MNATALLEIFAAAVAKAPGPSGLSGRIFVGARHEGGIRWLAVELGDRARATLDATDPHEGDAALVFGTDGAEWLLTDGAGSPDDVEVFGDVELLSAFVNRYVRHRSLLALLAGE